MSARTSVVGDGLCECLGKSFICVQAGADGGATLPQIGWCGMSFTGSQTGPRRMFDRENASRHLRQRMQARQRRLDPLNAVRHLRSMNAQSARAL